MPKKNKSKTNNFSITSNIKNIMAKQLIMFYFAFEGKKSTVITKLNNLTKEEQGAVKVNNQQNGDCRKL